jgi:beta-lactam-binding protein with PASTA domain
VSSYSISPSLTSYNSACVDWDADNAGGPYNVRVSIAAYIGDTENSVGTILGSTVVTTSGPDSYANGTACAYGLGSSTTYRFVMSIRKASDYSLLGTRTTYVTTAAAPPPTGTVPNVVGQTQGDASYLIQNAGFSPSGSTTTSGANASNNGTVASQSPSGGTTANLGSTVNFVVYNYIPPTTTVPDVVGQSQSTAVSNIQAALLSASVSTTTSGANSGNNGTVATQSPSPGTVVTQGSSVSITVYNYVVPPVTVPNVTGQSQSSAVSSIQSAGLVASVSYTSSGANSGNNGTVASQSPTGGTSVSSGSTVFITVYSFNPPVWIDNVISNTFTVGTSYSDSVSATNSPTYSISSGSLPAGISLNSSSGAITGTPTTPQGYSFTIRAANGDGAVTVSYSGNTGSPPVWVDQTLGSFLQGRGYSDAVSATNSPTYTISAGSLPAGISLNSSTGAVTGTPSGSGSYSFTIQASNSSGTITASFSGSIVLVPNWTDNTLGTVINGVAFSDGVSATNSPSYSVTSGSLPAGLSLNSSTGAVTGTPTGSVGTAYSFTITATNAQGSVSQAFSGSVQPDLTGQVSVFDGSTWSPKEVYVYDGTAWNKGALHIYNGTSWVKSSF